MLLFGTSRQASEMHVALSICISSKTTKGYEIKGITYGQQPLSTYVPEPLSRDWWAEMFVLQKYWRDHTVQ